LDSTFLDENRYLLKFQNHSQLNISNGRNKNLGEIFFKNDLQLRQSRVSGMNLPLGVTIMIAGGLCGYSSGNLILPW
jgi:hypothetical protein